MSKEKKYESQGAPSYNFHAHVHAHGGKTTCNLEHAHLHPGVTGTPLPVDGSHIHDMRGVTTFDRGHTHAYFAMTGPAISLPKGYHTHYVCFETNEVNGHRHQVMGFVEPSTR